MEDLEQSIESTEQTNTGVESEEQSEQSQGDGESEVELTEEQQVEASKRAEEERAVHRQKTIDQRFAKLTWEKNEAIRKAQELEQKYAKHEQSNFVEPQLHDFESIDDYVAALSTYQENKVEQSYNMRLEQQFNEQLRQAQFIKLDTSETEFQKLHADYPLVVKSLVDLSGGELSEHLSSVVLELGNEAPAVLYEIGKDPVEFVELLNMSPMHQLMKIGEVRASLKNISKTPKIPNAPTPVSPIQGRANTKKDPYKGSDDEFLRSRGLT